MYRIPPIHNFWKATDPVLKDLVRYVTISAGLEASNVLHRAGAMASARGLGAIFTLHHVRPYAPKVANTNDHLEITPEFLDAAIVQLKSEGYRFIRLEDIPSAIASRTDSRPFAVFSLDDGYRDNAEYALPVFARHDVPFTVFVCRGFSERTHTIWWETAAALLNASQAVDLKNGDGPIHYDVRTRRTKYAAFDHMAEAICARGEAKTIAKLDRAAMENGIDPKAIVEQLVMSGAELRKFSAHPLVSLGAHTLSHRALAYLSESEVRQELSASADYVEAITDRRPVTFAYPYGDRRSVTPEIARIVSQSGFTVGVTTSPGTVTGSSAQDLMLLPRISLNGYYQRKRYVSALASGIPFRLRGQG
ncbi:MAG: polysaccharide deacetylase family protein [Rhizobium sp.]